MTIAASDTGTWQTLGLLLVWVPLVMAWAFSFFDVFRREDISGLAKALWLVLVVLVPFFGTLVYLVFRPTGAANVSSVGVDGSGHRFHWQYSKPVPATLHALKVLSDLHDAGKLSDAEFDEQKRRLLAA